MKICDCCKDGIAKHLCLCPECDESHPLCDDCYKFGVEEGDIVPNKFDLNEIHPKIKEGLK